MSHQATGILSLYQTSCKTKRLVHETEGDETGIECNAPPWFLAGRYPKISQRIKTLIRNKTNFIFI